MIRILEMTDDQIINELAGDAEIARDGLRKVKEDAWLSLRTLALDLDDMNIRGFALSAAFLYVHHDHKKLVKLCEARDADLVNHIMQKLPNADVRRHGEQKAVPMVDAAIRNIIDEASMKGRLERLDDGAEAVQAFFRTMLERMQQAKYFLSNMYLNLDNGVYGHFEITLRGLVDKDRKPLIDPKADPTKENEMLADELLSKMTAPEQPAVPILTEAVSAAVDEFIAAQEMPAVVRPGHAEIASIDLNTLSYLLSAHESTMKKIIDPNFPIDRKADFRWAFFVTLSEMSAIVDGLIAGGTGINELTAKDFKEGRAALRLNNVFVQPELNEETDDRVQRPLNG